MPDAPTKPLTADPLSIIVISMGRPDCLFELMQSLNAQTRKPDRVLFVLTDPADAPALAGHPAQSVMPEIIITNQGTCHQRNLGIEHLDQKTGIIAFLDDDYVPALDALEAMEIAYKHFGPNIAGMSGHLIADGISGPGIAHTDALDLITNAPKRAPSILKDTIGLYGCNMVLRADAIGATRFDEGLPLYAWQEDVDFTYRIARATGKRMILTNAFSGVHRGVKSGRESRGIRLGYSQIINNWYLWKNSALPGRFALRVALRNVLANHLKLIKSEPWIDRRGRARGNRLALRDLALRSADPQRIHDL